MLLDQLTFEEKKAFQNIANMLASTEGKALEEESILEQYNDEMGLGFEYRDASQIDINKELESIKNSSAKNRKINILNVINFMNNLKKIQKIQKI